MNILANLMAMLNPLAGGSGASTAPLEGKGEGMDFAALIGQLGTGNPADMQARADVPPGAPGHVQQLAALLSGKLTAGTPARLPSPIAENSMSGETGDSEDGDSRGEATQEGTAPAVMAPWLNLAAAVPDVFIKNQNIKSVSSLVSMAATGPIAGASGAVAGKAPESPRNQVAPAASPAEPSVSLAGNAAAPTADVPQPANGTTPQADPVLAPTPLGEATELLRLVAAPPEGSVTRTAGVSTTRARSEGVAVPLGEGGELLREFAAPPRGSVTRTAEVSTTHARSEGVAVPLGEGSEVLRLVAAVPKGSVTQTTEVSATLAPSEMVAVPPREAVKLSRNFATAPKAPAAQVPDMTAAHTPDAVKAAFEVAISTPAAPAATGQASAKPVSSGTVASPVPTLPTAPPATLASTLASTPPTARASMLPESMAIEAPMAAADIPVVAPPVVGTGVTDRATRDESNDQGGLSVTPATSGSGNGSGFEAANPSPVPLVAPSVSAMADILTTTATSPANMATALGDKVIDMSVGGQWIDGLAREIAALGAGQGQATFRLSPENLGPLRVDMMPGDMGMNVTLTVETDAAQAALTPATGQLRQDAQLMSMRIGEVTVERAPHIAEAGRGDGTGGQAFSHNHSQSGADGQAAAQAALSQGQGQQNSAPQRKVPVDAAVLSHAEPQDHSGDEAQGGFRRARYA